MHGNLRWTEAAECAVTLAREKRINDLDQLLFVVGITENAVFNGLHGLSSGA